MGQRRSGEQTKQLLIDVGVGMLLRRGISAAVGHIRLQDVVRRAGLTSGAAYRLWPDQEAFQRDLAVAATLRHLQDPESDTIARIAPLIETKRPLIEIVREACAAHIESVESNDATPFKIALTLRATAITSQDLRLASQERHRRSVDRFTTLYRTLLETYEFALRPGRTMSEFAETMAALGEGFVLHAIEGIPHPRVTGPDGETWTLFGIAVWSLINGYVEPAAAVPLTHQSSGVT